MKLLRFALGLALAVMIQSLGQHLFSHFSLIIDPFLVLVVYFSLNNTPAWSSIGGSVAGLVQDALGGGPYGLHGFANTLVAYFSSRLQQRLVVQQSSQVGLLFSVAAAIQLATLAALQFLLVDSVELPGVLIWMGRLVFSGLLGATLFSLVGKAKEIDTRWRAKRTDRLKL